MNSELDQVQDMLAHFICADAKDESRYMLSRHSLQKNVTIGCEVDAGAVFDFYERRPTVAHTALSADRIFATDSKLLLNTPQDILQNHAEIALIDVDRIKWSCFRKLSKRPRGIWIEKPGASLYEYHSRWIYPNGKSDYAKRVAAIDKNGKPVRVIIEGTKNQSGMVPDGLALIIASSIIEDSHRPGAFTATIRDSVGVILPIEQGHHLELFKLRDGPIAGNRKRPLLHWVAKHIRRNQSEEWGIKSHLRGVHEFSIDGMHVKLEGELFVERKGA